MISSTEAARKQSGRGAEPAAHGHPLHLDQSSVVVPRRGSGRCHYRFLPPGTRSLKLLPSAHRVELDPDGQRNMMHAAGRSW